MGSSEQGWRIVELLLAVGWMLSLGWMLRRGISIPTPFRFRRLLVALSRESLSLGTVFRMALAGLGLMVIVGRDAQIAWPARALIWIVVVVVTTVGLAKTQWRSSPEATADRRQDGDEPSYEAAFHSLEESIVGSSARPPGPQGRRSGRRRNPQH